MKNLKFHIFNIIFLTFVAPYAEGQFKAAETDGAVDCGISSLYTLSKLSNKSLEVRQIITNIDGGNQRSHSLLELKNVANKLGLNLVGVKIFKSNKYSFSPALVFLNRAPHGHFVVIRAVGHSGSLVQVFDSDLPPQVFDVAKLFDSPEWTGAALMAPNPPYYIIKVSICVILSITIMIFAKKIIYPYIKKLNKYY